MAEEGSETKSVPSLHLSWGMMRLVGIFLTTLAS